MIWFVYRTHYEGVLGRRVRRLKAPSVLAWFARNMELAKKSEKPRKVTDKELGGRVYGLGSFFEATKEKDLKTPKSVAALRGLLEEHLYAEGDVRLDAHTLRVQTDDDEVETPYFFFDDVAAKMKDRVAYLLLEDARLPKNIGTGKYKAPVDVETLGPPGKGKGRTYVCLFTFADSDSVPGTVHAFDGVRLPELAEHLRTVTPDATRATWSKEFMETWPFEMRLLRAMVARKDADLTSALARCAKYPTTSVHGKNTTHAAIGPHAQAASEVAALAKGASRDGSPKKSIVHASPHAVLFADHATQAFGYQQWVLFDDLWASANPDLASSMLRYGTSWDPFGSGDDDDD